LISATRIDFALVFLHVLPVFALVFLQSIEIKSQFYLMLFKAGCCASRFPRYTVAFFLPAADRQSLPDKELACTL
jgi:hypothetical protein